MQSQVKHGHRLTLDGGRSESLEYEQTIYFLNPVSLMAMGQSAPDQIVLPSNLQKKVAFW